MPFGSPDGASDRTAHVDLTFSEADEQFRTEFRSWLDTNLPKEWRERGFWRRQDSDRAFEMRRTWEGDKAKAGFAGIQWPKEYGGRGGPPPMRAVYDQEEGGPPAPPPVHSPGHPVDARDLRRGDGAPPGATHRQLARPRVPRADDHGDRHRRAEARHHQAAAAQRGHLVPGLLRAERR